MEVEARLEMETPTLMRKFAFFVFVVFLSTLAVAQTKSGLYLDLGGQNFLKMEHAPTAEIGTKGVAKSWLVPGVMPSGIWKFNGKSAPTATSIHPHFVYRLRPEEDLTTRDIVIIRLDVRNDHREARAARISAWTGNSTRSFDKDRIVPLKTSIEHDGAIEFEPINQLNPRGEYFITIDRNARGYDFHVDSSVAVTAASILPGDTAVQSNDRQENPPDALKTPAPRPTTPKAIDDGQHPPTKSEPGIQTVPGSTISDPNPVQQSGEVSLGEAARQIRAKKQNPQ